MPDVQETHSGDYTFQFKISVTKGDDETMEDLFICADKEDSWLRLLGFTKGTPETKAWEDLVAAGKIASFSTMYDKGSDVPVAELGKGVITVGDFIYDPAADAGERLNFNVRARLEVAATVNQVFWGSLHLSHSIDR